MEKLVESTVDTEEIEPTVSMPIRDNNKRRRHARNVDEEQDMGRANGSDGDEDDAEHEDIVDEQNVGCDERYSQNNDEDSEEEQSPYEDGEGGCGGLHSEQDKGDTQIGSARTKEQQDATIQGSQGKDGDRDEDRLGKESDAYGKTKMQNGDGATPDKQSHNNFVDRESMDLDDCVTMSELRHNSGTENSSSKSPESKQQASLSMNEEQQNYLFELVTAEKEHLEGHHFKLQAPVIMDFDFKSLDITPLLTEIPQNTEGLDWNACSRKDRSALLKRILGFTPEKSSKRKGLRPIKETGDLAPIVISSSSGTSTTPVERGHERRSQFVDYESKEKFTCSKEVNDVSNAVLLREHPPK